MKRPGLFLILNRVLIPALIPAVLLAALAGTLPAQARTLDLAFMPPEVEPQDLCIPTPGDDPADDLETAIGDDGLTGSLRLRYIDRDILNLQRSDPDRWFDHILTLIDWRATLDADFAGTPALLARIALHVDAGRLEALQRDGLIDRLRNGDTPLANAQKMALAQYYLNGIGVVQDEGYARSLIREAAYGGNAEALMSLARMDLQGNPVDGWDAPLDMTVTLAFGGMLGQMNAQVCNHAERIAREYLNGDVVSRNPEVAYAWYKFAADLGGAQAAWRIVEFHLDADAIRKDNAEMLRYLRLAVQRGITVEPGQADQIKSAGDVDEATLRGILGFNFSADTGRNRPSVSPYFRLAVNLDGDFADPDSPYLDYLREVTRLGSAPGFVFTALAKEVLVRRGRWAGEPEALTLLEEAALRRDAEGMQLLAKRLMRYRDDPVQVSRAVNLLTDTVARFGQMTAMQDLDTLYRCQVNDAPRLAEATLWATNYRATQHAGVEVSPGDLISLDPFKKPEMLAQIQTQALEGQPQALADYLQRLQLDARATDAALRLWAGRTNRSDKALEEFAKLDFALATTPAERDLAVELFRRVYLNNGVTSALDLGIALTEDDSRDRAVAGEILALLTKAGNRGEGAAIRLKARLLGGGEQERAVFTEFAAIIEERGDFLALIFAIPHIANDRADDYIDRAVSLMNCTTKDTDELGDAAAILLSPDLSYQWRQVGLALEGGHVLAKLALSDRQLALFDAGRAPGPRDVAARDLADGDASALRSLFLLAADPDLDTYDAEAATDHLLALLRLGNAGDETWVLSHYRHADPTLRALIAPRIDMKALYLKAAGRGDIAAKLDFALLLRDTAEGMSDLQASARWLKEASEGGNITAMAELGEVLAYGIGIPRDPRGALIWLEQAERAGNPRAAGLARQLRLEKIQ
jgi:TPR repeat protein